MAAGSKPGRARASVWRSHDPRTLRTRAAIVSAAQELARERAGEPEGEITVADLAARAAISRNSFYTHFSGIADVAAHLLTERSAALAATLADGPPGRAVLARAAVPLLEHIAAHRVLYAALDREGAGAMERITAIYREHLRRIAARRPGLPAGLDLDFVAAYGVGGFLGALGAWLRGDLVCTPAEFAEQVLTQLPPWLLEPPPARVRRDAWSDGVSEPGN